MIKAALTFIPIVAFLAAAMARHLVFVRLLAIAAILLCALLSSGVLIAPHRFATDRHGPQNGEWRRGTRDARDIVHQALPILGTSFFALAVLAAVPMRRKPNEDTATQK